MKAAVIVRFCRKQGEAWETGISLTQQTGISDIKAIIDENGEYVDEIYDYSLCYIYGCMLIPPAENFKGRGGK